MRILVTPTLLLLLAAPSLAQDRIADALRGERFKEALLLVEERLLDKPQNKQLLEQWAKAIRGLARDLQRAEGYDKAIQFLEKNLTHWLVAEAYSETCLWGGRELHGVTTLRRSGLPIAERILPELRLLAQLRRYDEIVDRAREAKQTVTWKALDEWERFGRDEAAMRARLLDGATRGRNAAMAALGVIAVGALVLYRLAPRRQPPAADR